MARITIRGKIKWPRLPLLLNYTCKPPLYRPAAAPQKKAECSFVLATGRLFDCLLVVSPDNCWAQKQLPLAKVSEKQRGKDKKGDRVKRGTWVRDGQQGEICVFSFHYTESLKNMGEEKKCPCQNGSLWRCWEVCGCHPLTLS